LIQLEYSPVAALNRTYALAKANGKQAAIVEAEKMQLIDNPFYFSLLGELYTNLDNAVARQHFENAFSIIKTNAGRLSLQKKIDALKSGG